MSEYQYYEFCRLKSTLPAAARRKMVSLSSRAQLGTHNACYVYNYGDFRGDEKKLLLRYFDVFFYISNFGTMRLMLKYSVNEIDLEEIKKYQIKDFIRCQKNKDLFLLSFEITTEEGGGWIKGDGMLSDLLPLYDEIIEKDYRLLALVTAIHDEYEKGVANRLSQFYRETKLSAAQKQFLDTFRKVTGDYYCVNNGH